MAALSNILRSVEGGGLMFRCPGCGENHMVRVGDGAGPRWGYNGDPERPTFTPSILIKTGHHCAGQEGKDCWCTYEERVGRPAPFKCTVCHSFVTDGKVQFLSDCTHYLAGQMVAIPDFDAG